MRNLTNSACTILLIALAFGASACGSNTFVGESEAQPAPKKVNSLDAKDTDTDKNDKDFGNDTDEDNQSLLTEETDECNAQGGILLNDSCQVCSAGQTVDAASQTCVLAAGQDSSTPDAGSIGGGGDSGVDVKGLVDVFGELIKNLPKDDGSGGGPGGPGGGGCG